MLQLYICVARSLFCLSTLVMEIKELNALIAKRRSIYPKTYIEGKAIEKSDIEQILENANWAPSHRKTEPWRFHVLHSLEKRQAFGDFAIAAHKKMGREMPEAKIKRVRKAPVQAGCVIVLILHRDPEERVPEWEELAALSCAVQNMWLTCSAMGLGSYWSTPKNVIALMHNFIPMADNEKCAGLFYIGHHELPEIAAQRGAIAEKTTWY